MRGGNDADSVAFPTSGETITYHQQYLAKNPGGYCPDHSCGVSFKSAELQVGEKA